MKDQELTFHPGTQAADLRCAARGPRKSLITSTNESTDSSVMSFPPTSTEAAGPRLLHRLTAPLRQAGWSQVDVWDESNGEEQEHFYTEVEMERSGFHISLGWRPSAGELTAEDPTEGWDWAPDQLLPPLFPLDEPLIIQIPALASQSLQSQVARQAFAAAGLLDATLVLVPEKHSSLRADLVQLLPISHVCDVRMCGRGGRSGNGEPSQ